MPRSPRQLELSLVTPNGWGGRRAGAGRKPQSGPRIPHLRRGAITRHTPCHLTLRVRRNVASLRSARLVRELERSFAEACERGTFRLVHYSIQRDHVHLIVEADDAAALGRGMSSIGARLARAVNRVFRRRGKVFADRFHHRVLRTPREVRNVLAYALHNARKHAPAGRAAGPAVVPPLDPASSSRWFSGWTRSVAPAPPAAGIAPVARARSWLLRVGWLRHGRIDPGEAPGRHRRRTPRRDPSRRARS